MNRLRSPSRATFLVVLACAVLAAQAAGAQTAAAPQSDAAVKAIGLDFDRFLRDVDPLRASDEGDRDALRRLPDVSRTTELARKGVLTALRERLERLDPATLSDSAALDHSLLVYVIGQRIEEIDLDLNRIAFR